jgi:alkanesulfonate monooxygenase SsuD/methylene tetrahydromethanopterin reductase-like flavin-dependent oxidoreductase (luciferase family)
VASATLIGDVTVSAVTQTARIGISLMLGDDGITPTELAVAVEERGFESLWLPEHSHIPTSRETPWPGSLSGEPLPDVYSHLLDMTVSLAMAASVTTTIRLGTSVALVAARDPLWTAKEYATLDVLSGGRHVAFTPSWAWPKPVQPVGPRIHIGGGAGPRLLGAVAAWGDGWLPISARPSLADRLAKLDEACDRAGRDRADIDVSVFGATTDPGGLANLFDEGVHRAVLTLPSHDRDSVLRQLDQWAPLVDAT